MYIPTTASIAILITIQLNYICRSQEFPTIFLEEGKRGIVPCSVQWIEESSIYWYKGTTENTDLIISKHNGQVSTPNGFDIDNSRSLVIRRVTKSNEGLYICRIFPRANPDESVMVEVKANSDLQPVYLERGQRGEVPCLPIKHNRYSPGPNDSIHWYFKSTRSSDHIVTRFLGKVTSPARISDGAFQVDSDFNLIIVNVTDSNEGNYFYQLRERRSEVHDGQVRVEVKVSPRDILPVVTDCVHNVTTCEVLVPQNAVSYNLTCVFYYAKPVVEMKWFTVLEDGHLQDANASSRVEKTVLPANSTRTDRFRINNTYTTSATIQLQLSHNEDSRYRCVVYGAALGDKTGSNVTVTINKTRSPITAPDPKSPPASIVDPGTPGIILQSEQLLNTFFKVFLFVLLFIIMAFIILSLMMARVWGIELFTRIKEKIRSQLERRP